MSQRLTNAAIRTLVDPVLAAAKNVTAISQASPAVCTSTAHGYSTGDYAFLTSPSVDAAAGPALYKVTRVDANNFSVPYDNSGGTGGAQTAKALKVTAGLVANLKPYDLHGIEDALARVKHEENTDAQAGAGESSLDNIFPASGPNP